MNVTFIHIIGGSACTEKYEVTYGGVELAHSVSIESNYHAFLFETYDFLIERMRGFSVHKHLQLTLKFIYTCIVDRNKDVNPPIRTRRPTGRIDK